MKAIELIVDGYVRLGDRRVLEDLRIHRQRLVADLKRRTGFDLSLSIGHMEEDLAVIETGLEKLRAADGPAPSGGTDNLLPVPKFL